MPKCALCEQVRTMCSVFEYKTDLVSETSFDANANGE